MPTPGVESRPGGSEVLIDDHLSAPVYLAPFDITGPVDSAGSHAHSPDIRTDRNVFASAPNNVDC